MKGIHFRATQDFEYGLVWMLFKLRIIDTLTDARPMDFTLGPDSFGGSDY